ncbi:MAG: hypothetical protein GY711_24910 [bacterium]|nr:hypothetical protein [bacterium]
MEPAKNEEKNVVEETVRDTWDYVRTQLEKGTMAVRDSIGRLPFLASVAASAQHDDVDRDETHYFLIPSPFTEAGYALYSARRLPPGTATVNDLPRLRVFHLPGEGSETALVDLVIAARQAESSAAATAPAPGGPSLADRLEFVADEIDRHERKVTGGILLIGGAVAIANPVLGVGIAAKAIFPSLGAIASREGLKLAGDKLRDWTQRRQTQREEEDDIAAEQMARKEFAGTPVTSIVNPVLRNLELALRTSGAQFDPSFDADFVTFDVEGWNERELFQLTVQAITESYGDADGESVAPEFTFGPEDRRWLELLQLIHRRAGVDPGRNDRS